MFWPWKIGIQAPENNNDNIRMIIDYRWRLEGYNPQSITQYISRGSHLNSIFVHGMYPSLHTNPSLFFFSACVKRRGLTLEGSIKNRWMGPILASNLTISGWWYTYTSEKWWSSSVGMMKFPIYGNIKFMFRTTNQYLLGYHGVPNLDYPNVSLTVHEWKLEPETNGAAVSPTQSGCNLHMVH